MVKSKNISETALCEGLRRQEVIRPLAKRPGLSKGQVADAANVLGLSRARIYDLIKRYRSYPCVDALIHSKWTQGDRWKSRLAPEIEAIIKNCIDKYYLGMKEPIPIRALYAVLEQECLQAGLDVPSEQTLRRRIARLPDRELARAGKLTGPSNKRDYHPQHHIVEGYLDEIQIDHTMVDAMIDLSSYGLGIRRPWVTLAIDVATRLIYGYYIGLRHPTYLNTCMVLLQGTSNKTEWLQGKGFQYSFFEDDDVPDLWPSCSALPEVVFTDRGKDFKSKTTQLACASLGIKIRYRPAGATHFGGHIERLIGSFMKHHKMLLGYTGSNSVERADYNSSKHAILTLEDYEQWLLLEILQYHSAKHSKLGKTPIQKFNEVIGCHVSEGLHPLDRWRIRYAFLKRETRKVGPNGITILGRTYSHPRLGELDGQKVCVFFDHSDNRYASLSLDGVSEYLSLTLEEDGKPAGHQDIVDIKFKDPGLIAETKRFGAYSRKLVAEQVKMMSRIKKSRSAHQIPRIISKQLDEDLPVPLRSKLVSDVEEVKTFSIRKGLL